MTTTQGIKNCGTMKKVRARLRKDKVDDVFNDGKMAGIE